jgi:hypothetical protein
MSKQLEKNSEYDKFDTDGDGVVTATEVKEVAVAAAKKWCF